MRALHLVKTAVGAHWALRLMRELVKLGVEVHAAMPAGPLLGRYGDIGVVVHELQTDIPVTRPWQWPGLARRFRKLVQQVQPDVIHSHFVGTTMTMRMALGKNHPIPRVFQVPGPLHLEHAFFRNAELCSSGPRDYWIGTCAETCAVYRRCGIAPERVFLSYYGLDLEQYHERSPGALRRELGLDARAPLVGMVAFMYAPRWFLGQRRGLKGHEDLVDALVLARRREPGLHGVFIGGPWNNALNYEACVRQYARQRLGAHATFLGTRRDVADLYPDFDVAAHPSHSENLGAAAESLLSAVPTIATRVGGFPDVVKPNETGWLVPPRDPPALAEAILEALRDPQRSRQLAKRGQALARSLLDVHKNAAEVLQCYERMAQAK